MSFLRSVAVLVSGTALGHGITAAALPVLSRLYTPADFSLLAVFAGLVSIISVAACLRFDIAIALPENDSDALTLLILALCTAFMLTLVLLTGALIAPRQIAELLQQPALGQYLWLVPLSVLLAGGYSALQMWFVRQRQFQMVARSRITQSTAAAGVQVTSGALSTGPSGLLFGYAMNTGAACLILGYSLLQDKSNRSAIKATTWQSIKQAFKDYDRFPKYSTWEALSNTASIQLPIILIAAVAAPKEAGYLMMANYVMQAPTALIGAAVGQVYLSQAAEKHRQGKLSEFTNEVLRGLFRTGVAPLLAIGAIAPFTFGLIFGTGWDRAGILVAWMTPWFILQFLTAPISMSLHVTGNQRAAFFLQLFGLVLRLGMVWSASQLIVTKTSETFAISGLVFYAIYLCITITKIRQAESAS